MYRYQGLLYKFGSYYALYFHKHMWKYSADVTNDELKLFGVLVSDEQQPKV